MLKPLAFDPKLLLVKSSIFSPAFQLSRGVDFRPLCLQEFVLSGNSTYTTTTHGLPSMANPVVQTQLPIMVRKSLRPSLAKNGMYLKDIAGDGTFAHP